MTSTALPRAVRRRAAASRERAATDQPWVRPALAAILVVAALLCLWGLTASGSSNTYYAAAVKSATEDWKAWFFGSLDPGSFITVDKPPLAIWLMGLSGRVFGFSSFSMLLPEALCGVGAVAVLYATVRRVFGSTAGLIAAAALAVSPVSVAVARVNNPDALLVLLLVVSAYFTVRAIESGATKHLAWAGAFVGLAFMTKMLQGWMVLPALTAAYLVAGPPQLLTRVRQLAIAGVVMAAVSAAWPVAVTLWPGSAPYIGGSTDGSVWDLILGYNGFGRIFGEGEGGNAAHPPAGFGGAAGLWRLFNEQVGGQVAWLLPLTAAGLIAGLVVTRSAPRTDRVRAGFVLFGAWALVHALVFSTQQGIFHPYYVSALAPGVAALVGGGAVVLTRWARTSWVGLAVLDAGILASAYVAVLLLGRTPDFAPWLRTAIPVLAALAVFASAALKLPGAFPRRTAAIAAIAATLAVGAGPAAYSATTASHGLNGNNVTAGPSSSGFGGRGDGAMGGSTADSPLLSYLEAHQGSAKYLVAAVGSQSSAQIILATGEPVVTIGGFSGSDNAPTVSQLAAMVKAGELKYVLLGGGFGGGGDRGGTSAITAWVQAHGKAVSGVSTSSGTLYEVSA